MYKVLLVDDEPNAKRSLKNIVERDMPGFCVAGLASNGREALQLIEEAAPHIVITDIRMPVMDGLRLAEEIKSAYSGIEVVIVSGYSHFEYAQSALRFGVTDYLLKPIEAGQVHDILQRIAAKLKRKDWNVLHRNYNFFHYKENLRQLAEAVWMLHEDKMKSELLSLHREYTKETSEVADLRDVYLHLLSYIVTYLEARGVPPSLREHDPGLYLADSPDDIASRVQHFLRNEVMDLIRGSRHWGSHNSMLKAVNYIKETFMLQHFSLSLVSEQVGMSPSYFSKCFKEEVGVSFIGYVTRLRMEQSIELLNDSSYKVYEVAHAVGYAEYPHFAKIFKKTYGMSPTDYRSHMGVI